MPLRNGMSAGEWVGQQRGAERAIESICRLAPIEKIEITDTGVVKAYRGLAITSLPAELRQLMLNPDPYIAAIGAGLPVVIEKKKEPEPPVAPEQPETEVKEKPAEKQPAEGPGETTPPAGTSGDDTSEPAGDAAEE